MQPVDLKGRLLSAGADLVVPGLLLGYATTYYLEVRGLPRPAINLLLIEPVYFVLLVSCLSFAAIRLWHAMKGPTCDLDGPKAGPVDLRRSAAFVGLTVAYAALIPVAGFVIASTIYVVMMCFALGMRSVIRIVAVAAFSVATIWFSIEYWLGLELPRGLVF